MLRDMAWLTSQRARLYGGALAIPLIVLLVSIVLHCFQRGGYDPEGHLLGEDFLSFWAASRQILLGQSADVYVPTLHHLAELPFLRQGDQPFFYPPTYMLICLPLALAPFFMSYGLFVGTTAMAFLAIMWRILRSPWSAVAILAYPPIYINILAGQNAFLTAAILGCGLGMLNRRPSLSGATLGLMVIKPHLALALPIALIVTGRWRTLAWAGLSALCFVALSYLQFGSHTWFSFLNNSHVAREFLEQGLGGFVKMQSMFVTARALGASVGAAYALQGFVALSAVCTLIWTLRQPIAASAERSMIVIACLLISPYSLHYDMVIIALPMAWMLREWQRDGFPAWSKLVLCLAFLAPMTYYPFLALAWPFGLPVLVSFGCLLVRGVAKPHVSGAANTHSESIYTEGWVHRAGAASQV
jgi:hypothetical protein